MSTYDPNARCLESFSMYVLETSSKGLQNYGSSDLACLADFIECWIDSGEGLQTCAGNFETLMVAVVVITDAWQRDPEHFLNYHGDNGEEHRRVDSVLGELGTRHLILSRAWFERRMFEFVHSNTARF